MNLIRETVLIRITGKVQGVFFRHYTREKAINLGLTGYVENLKDGSVNLIASGSPEQLEQLINWSHNGPDKAKVEKVTVSRLPYQEFSAFTIKRN